MRVALLAVAAALAHSAPAAPPLLRLTGPVKELAADGGRVAVLVQTSRPRCTVQRVAVWQPSTRSLAPIGASPCSESVSTGAGIWSVALAGTRVAYVQYAGGNTRELELKAATLPQRKPVVVASAAFDLDALNGTFFGRVAGDGSLLAFDWWSVCAACAGASRAIPDSSAVWRVVPRGSLCPDAGLGALGRCAQIRSQPAIARLVAVGGGSVAVLGPDGTVGVVAPDGVARVTIPFAPGELRAARLEADGTLVALVASGTKNALRVYAPTGALTATYQLPSSRTSGDAVCGDPSGCKLPALRLEDADDGIAVWVSGTTIHLLRLADGRSATIRPPGRAPVHAQLEQDGLYSSYSLTATASRVAFRPFASLAPLFR